MSQQQQQQNTENDKNRKKKKKKKKKRKDGLSIVEQRLQEAQEAVDRQEKEEKRRIFEAWTHGFDEEGVLVFSNSVLKENQYEKPKGYKTGKLPTPAEHLWEDVFKKIDKKKRGAIEADDIKAAIGEEEIARGGRFGGRQDRAERERKAQQIIRILSRTPRHTEEITYEDWKELRDRLPLFTKTQIRIFVEQFKLKPKQYYRLDEEDEKEESNDGDDNDDDDLPKGWSRGIDDESGRVYYYNDETGESTWEPPPEVVQQQEEEEEELLVIKNNTTMEYDEFEGQQQLVDEPQLL